MERAGDGAADAPATADAAVDGIGFDSPLTFDSLPPRDVVEECREPGQSCTTSAECCFHDCDTQGHCATAALYGMPPPPPEK